MILETVVYGDVTLLDLLRIVVILVIAIVIAKGLTLNIKRGLRDKIDKYHIEVITKVVYYGIIVIAVLAVLPILGIKLSGLLVAGGIAGIVIGIASQSVVGNLIAGLFLMIERPMKIGQSVNIAGIAGVIEDIRVISTTLRTFDGLYVRLPNEKVFTSNITNYVEHAARRVEYIVGIRYSDDADKAIGIIRNLSEEYPLTLKSPTGDIFVDNLGDNAVNIIVRLWAPSTEWYSVKKELLWKIKRALEDEEIEIAFPQRTVWFANELQKQELDRSEVSESGSE
jgi:small-conductance mechanosensitive channel